MTFGGSLWILEHHSVIGFVFLFFFLAFVFVFVFALPIFEVKFAKAEMTVYS